MDFQLRQNLLGVVASRVAADSQLPGYRQIRAALREQPGHLNLSAGQSKTFSQIDLGACPVTLR